MQISEAFPEIWEADRRKNLTQIPYLRTNKMAQKNQSKNYEKLFTNVAAYGNSEQGTIRSTLIHGFYFAIYYTVIVCYTVFLLPLL